MVARVTGQDEGIRYDEIGFGPLDHDINLPPFNVGDLVLCLMVSIPSGFSEGTPPPGWTTLSTYDDWNTKTWIGGRHITGTEGYVGDGSDVETYIANDSDSAHVTLTIAENDTADQAPPVGGLAGLVTSEYPNPPNVNFDVEGSHLVIAMMSGIGTFSLSSYPSNYDDDQYTVLNDNNTDQTVAVASRTVDGSSENPGVFTLSVAGSWRAATVAIPSLPSGGGFGSLGL